MQPEADVQFSRANDLKHGDFIVDAIIFSSLFVHF